MWPSPARSIIVTTVRRTSRAISSSPASSIPSRAAAQALAVAVSAVST